MTPYTYFIGWPEHNVFYYGVRYGKTSKPEDLWVSYFTSSREVHAFRAQHGDPPLREVRRVFTLRDQARAWEHKVLRRLKAPLREDFLNRTTALAPSMLGRSHSEETKIKMSLWQKGQKKPAEAVERMRVALTGRKDTAEQRENKSRGHLGIVFSESHCANIAAAKMGRKHWVKDGVGKFCIECPGPGWVRGKKDKRK